MSKMGWKADIALVRELVRLHALYPNAIVVGPFDTYGRAVAAVEKHGSLHTGPITPARSECLSNLHIFGIRVEP